MSNFTKTTIIFLLSVSLVGCSNRPRVVPALTDNENHIYHETNSISTNDQNRIEAIRVVDLVIDPKKYEGKYVQITGECIKVNHNVMNRNWIHVQDGSHDTFDLVITSSELVLVGSEITMQAVVTLDKNFGAGYRYDIILENGTLIQ